MLARFAALVILLSTTSALSAEPSSSRILDRLEASVNASAVLASDVRKFRETLTLRAELDPLFASSSLARKGKESTDEEVISALIQDRLVLGAYPVADSEVEQEINTIQSSSRLSRDRLKTALAERGAAFEDYFELIRLSTAKRNLIDRDIRSKVAISDDDVKNEYYNRFAAKQAAPMSYRLRVISISRKSFNTVQAMNEAAARAQAALRSGDSFEEVARRYSDHPSAETGGDLGTLTEDQISSDFRRELKKMKVGQHSVTFGNPNERLFVLKLVGVDSAEDATFQRVREEIRTQLSAAEYQRQIQLWLERQEKSAFIHRATRG